jgi:hypothetical protein
MSSSSSSPDDSVVTKANVPADYNGNSEDKKRDRNGNSAGENSSADKSNTKKKKSVWR